MSRRTGAPPRQSSPLALAELQLAEASIQSLPASLAFQPSLIRQLRDKSIPGGGPTAEGYSKGNGQYPV